MPAYARVLCQACSGRSAVTPGLLRHALRPELTSHPCYLSTQHFIPVYPRFWSRQTWLQIPVFPPISYVSLDNIFTSPCLIQNIGNIIVPVPPGGRSKTTDSERRINVQQTLARIIIIMASGNRLFNYCSLYLFFLACLQKKLE